MSYFYPAIWASHQHPRSSEYVGWNHISVIFSAIYSSHELVVSTKLVVKPGSFCSIEEKSLKPPRSSVHPQDERDFFGSARISGSNQDNVVSRLDQLKRGLPYINQTSTLNTGKVSCLGLMSQIIRQNTVASLKKKQVAPTFPEKSFIHRAFAPGNPMTKQEAMCLTTAVLSQ